MKLTKTIYAEMLGVDGPAEYSKLNSYSKTLCEHAKETAKRLEEENHSHCIDIIPSYIWEAGDQMTVVNYIFEGQECTLKDGKLEVQAYVENISYHGTPKEETIVLTVAYNRFRKEKQVSRVDE